MNQKNHAANIDYSKHQLARIITVYQIVSADYVEGRLTNDFHTHTDAWELVYCKYGRSVVTKETTAVEISAGQIAFVSPGVEHAISESDSDAVFAISYTCTGSYYSSYIRQLQDTVFTASRGQQELFESMMQELEKAYEPGSGKLRLSKFTFNKEAPIGAEQLICCYLEEIIVGLLRNITMQKGKPVKSGHFENAIESYLAQQITDYIAKHLSEQVSIEQIARQFHYSRTRISTLFRESTGESIMECRTRLRIEKAKSMLVRDGYPVFRVAEELGFTTEQYFSKRFKEVVGSSPTQYVQDLSG